ncbi:MAG TPA: hypothetical protein VNZ54_06925 [bacterium]|nr:hypothetical protein [bacterium]
MELAATLVVLLLLGLALSQAWLLWFLRREVARLDQRVDESLDAEDLVEFQEQLQGLLEQVKEAGLELAQSLEIRHAAVGKAVEKARDAEQKMAVRLQAMEKVADGMAQRLKHAEEQAAAAGAIPRKANPKAKAPERPRPEPKTGPTLEPKPAAPVDAPPAAAEAAPQMETAAEAAGRARSYLSRPAVQPRHQRVYELADQGWTHEQIAKEAGLLPGEVDLILNLRRQRPSQG